MTQKLSLTATREEIIARLSEFKIHALNYAHSTISDPNIQHMEPREVKQLTDIVLSLEDSIVNSDQSEGKQARTVRRLLDRYTIDETANTIINKSSYIPVDIVEKEE